MPTLLDAKRRAAAALVLGLGVALLIALAPYATGLVWIPVLYVALAPVYAWRAARAREVPRASSWRSRSSSSSCSAGRSRA